MVVVAFMASQMTDTYAKENQGNPQILDNLQQHDTDVKADIVTHDGYMTTEHNALAAILEAVLASCENGDGNGGATASASVPQLGTVKCGETVTIYENHATVNNNVSFMVTVTVSDFCRGLGSRLTGIRRSQDDPPINVTVPDGSTITASFAIRNTFSGGKIELECIGDSGEGFCIYKIEDIQMNEF